MRKLTTISTSIVLLLVVATAALAQVRGRARLQGVVTDPDGKPIAGATVTVAIAGEQTKPIVVKTDSKGKWSALGLTNGTWNIDIAAEGFEPSKGSAAVSEYQLAPPIKTSLARVVVQVPVPAEEIPIEPIIPQLAIDAVKQGQDLLKQSGAEGVSADDAKSLAKQAVTHFEKAFPMVPTDKPETVEIRNQLMQVMAQAYYRAGDLPKAIAMLEQANAVDPWTTPDPSITQRNVLLVNLYLENGDLAKGRTLLEKLPGEAVTDPTVYINIGILFMNKKNPADAATYFTKAVEMDPKRADSYYYRGLARLQLKKNKEAKADFEQVMALAPQSPEAADAKQYLAALK